MKILQIPESILDKRSKAYNKGKVFIHGANEMIANAYKKQFQTDLAGFLRARAVEMKGGGSMFLVCLGRTSMDPTDQGGAGLLFGTHFQDAWNELVLEVKKNLLHFHSHSIACQIKMMIIFISLIIKEQYQIGELPLESCLLTSLKSTIESKWQTHAFFLFFFFYEKLQGSLYVG